ncbi:MAG: AraC family transcriptional regulator, partial [Phyllobacteriaceae bacterium]|nr:AraC family transcriptional regulator [Phyllobacteriaceae bacterium]
MSAASSVFDRLSVSRARLGGRLEVGRGRGVALWSNVVDRVRYENTGHHTISLYLSGGEESRRVDRGSVRGWPGALIVMPRGSTSDWAIGGAFDFVHLYLDDAQLRHFAVATLDRDPSGLALAELTFATDPVLAGGMRRLARSCRLGDVFAAEQEIVEVCHGLLTASVHGGRPAAPIRGGLSPAVARRVIERMRASLDRPPSLDELAAEA